MSQDYQELCWKRQEWLALRSIFLSRNRMSATTEMPWGTSCKKPGPKMLRSAVHHTSNGREIVLKAWNYNLISLSKKRQAKGKQQTYLGWDIKEPWWCSFWFWVCQLCSKLEAQGKVSCHEKPVMKYTERKTQQLPEGRLKRYRP